MGTFQIIFPHKKVEYRKMILSIFMDYAKERFFPQVSTFSVTFAHTSASLTEKSVNFAEKINCD